MRYQRRPGDPYDPAIEASREARGKKRLPDAVVPGSYGRTVPHEGQSVFMTVGNSAAP
jgi:hypothetical protein